MLRILRSEMSVSLRMGAALTMWEAGGASFHVVLSYFQQYKRGRRQGNGQMVLEVGRESAFTTIGSTLSEG